VAVGLVTGIAFLVILSLTRPIDALIAGAKAAADGDLSRQIPVSSRDQIGYLTQVFNKMTSSLLDSRQKLEKMTRTDELTGLPNRRELDRMFSTELGRAERSDRRMSVLMLDLDNFKQFNDQYGHLKGDSLLSEASHFLNLNLRPTDIATRYGGEEFVILLPETTKRQAAALAERLRQQFAEACQEADESSPWVTISIGVATWPEDGKTREALIRAADTALYSAKRAGRNRVRTAVFPAPLLEQTSVDPHEIA
ncbi:MAG: diguanylate cyclase, partial [Acidobacteriota bacterium]